MMWSDETLTRASTQPVVETRRLELLRPIANSGGKISPYPTPTRRRNMELNMRRRVETSRTPWCFLRRQNYLEARFFDRVILCPKCDTAATSTYCILPRLS